MGVFGCMTNCVRLNQWRWVAGEGEKDSMNPQEIEVLFLRKKEESYFPNQKEGRIGNKATSTD